LTEKVYALWSELEKGKEREKIKEQMFFNVLSAFNQSNGNQKQISYHKKDDGTEEKIITQPQGPDFNMLLKVF
jgi:hypothetical protein